MLPTISTSSGSSEMESSSQIETSTTCLNDQFEEFANGVFPKFLEPSLEEWTERRRLGRQAEAQRLKERLSHRPFHAQRAAGREETYWLMLAGSYMGD